MSAVPQAASATPKRSWFAYIFWPQTWMPFGSRRRFDSFVGQDDHA